MKAAAAEQLFFRRNSVLHVVGQVLRPMRVLATCTVSEPWQLNADDIRSAIRISCSTPAIGQIAGLNHRRRQDTIRRAPFNRLGTLIRIAWRPATICERTCAGEIHTVEGSTPRGTERQKAGGTIARTTRVLGTDPHCHDARSAYLCGLTQVRGNKNDDRNRVSDRRAALLPLDWKRQRNYFDAKGKPAGLSGGISTSVMIRHFAEKQQSDESDSNILVEGAQPIPELFLEIINRTLDRATSLTSPLRKTHKLQCETGSSPYPGTTPKSYTDSGRVHSPDRQSPLDLAIQRELD